MHRIRSIGVTSVGNQWALVWAAIGLLASPFTFQASRNDPKWGGVVAVAVYAVIVGPIGCALFGFVFGGFAALVYNWTAKWTGGIQVEIEEIVRGGASASAGK